MWKQLNEVVSDFVKSGRIKVEERQKIALRSFERDDDVINTAMGRHEKTLRSWPRKRYSRGSLRGGV